MAGSLNVFLAEGLKMAVDQDGLATVYMVNGENRFRLSFINAWMKVLDEIERLKLGKGKPQRDAVIFSKRLSASEAHAYQIVDVIESADKLLSAAADLIKDCLGKYGIARPSLGAMKKDVYGYKAWQHDEETEGSKL